MKYEIIVKLDIDPEYVIDYVDRFACDYCYSNLTELLEHNEIYAIKELIEEYLDHYDTAYDLLTSNDYLDKETVIDDIYKEIIKNKTIQISLDI